MEHSEKTLTSPAAERGDAARHKLIEAAIRIFGQYGFEGASTRRLAAEAGVNIAAIPYYFGGKEGLYLAAADHIVTHFKESVGGAVERVNHALDRPDLSDEECRRLLHLFVGEMTKFILGGSRERIHISRIITREQLDPTPAFDRIYEGVIRGMHQTMARLVSRLTGIGLGDPTLRLRTQALFGQIVTFKSSRETALRNMGWKAFGEKEIEIVTGVVQFHIDAVIDAYRRQAHAKN